MPPPDDILSGLAGIANQWSAVAIAWHVAFGALLLGLAAGWRPSNRLAGACLTVPLLTVSALAWTSGNPFNGGVFAALFLVLAERARRLHPGPVRIASRGRAGAGALLVAFGWAYPHFLVADSWLAYLYAAPLGLIPCPTLSVMVGITLLFRGFGSRAWSVTLAGAGLVYGVIGVLWLGVTIDLFLLFGSIALLAPPEEEFREPSVVRLRQFT
jgi:hypothetical protein